MPREPWVLCSIVNQCSQAPLGSHGAKPLIHTLNIETFHYKQTNRPHKLSSEDREQIGDPQRQMVAGDGN